ncbi:MAG: PilZ domain-containing protein [Nitrospira sp.]|nr:PilZ domain-containing protein [Nitrospira sp.]MCB9711336.1 PilZ domain-containing protein [Nitrospiraceae bacterium]MDR4486346.1 PilZ domain-containing protein [Nitrospirales bacterium]
MNSLGTEDRRQNCRVEVPVCLWVEVPLAFSYESVDLAAAEFSQWQWEELAVSPDLVHAMVEENDLTIRDPLLMQMVTRIDWMLTSVLRTLGKEKKYKQALPEFRKVNLSGSGMGFASEQHFPVDSHLILRLVLRPFIPIQAIGKVLRTEPVETENGPQFQIAVEFVQIAPDDREAIIRHILRTQATIQRHRLQNSSSSSVL